MIALDDILLWSDRALRWCEAEPRWWFLASLAFGLALSVAWWGWVGYPEAEERAIRRGKHWVYVPLYWVRHRVWLRLAGWGVHILVVLATWVGAVVFVPLLAIEDWFVGVVACCVAIGALASEFGLWRLWGAYRLRLQQESYFFDLFRLFREWEIQGRRVVEVEIQGLVAWEHQHVLRRADESGCYLKTLKMQALRSRGGHEERRDADTI